jgi:hypothetical protein
MLGERELRALAIDGALYENALGGVGLYCASVIGGPDAYEKRTERMEGWNAAVMKIHSVAVTIGAYLNNLPPDQKQAAEDLMLSERLRLHLDDQDRVVMLTGLNDVFACACAEQEVVEPEELVQLSDMNETWGYDGVVAWAWNKQGVEPDNYLLYTKDNRVQEARDWLKRGASDGK